MTNKTTKTPGAEEYEYAGFRYLMVPMLGSWTVVPVDGQHAAANKEKHKRSALEVFLTEKKDRK